MLTAKFDPQSFFQRADNVALHVPAAEVFGLLRRRIDLPGQWAALVGRSTGDQSLVPAGGVVEGDGAADVLFVRTSPLEVEWVEADLTSEDGFNFSVSVRLRVAAIAERSELQCFLRAIVGSVRVVRADGLAAYFAGVVRESLAKFAAERSADQLFDPRIGESASEAVRSSLDGLCFSAGLGMERSPGVRFDSVDFRDVRKLRDRATVRREEHEVAKQLDEAACKARSEHLDRLAELLGRLRAMASESPEVGLFGLIRAFPEHQRGELYEALFSAPSTGSATRWIVVAAGEEMIFFDGQRPGEPVRRIRLDGEAGPARSVQATRAAGDRSVLWIGASRGVYIWPLDRVAPESSLLVESRSEIRGGFNAVAVAGDRVVATHSELGIHEWDRSEGIHSRQRFSSRTRGAKVVRNATSFDGDWYVSVDDGVLRWSIGRSEDSPEAVYSSGGSAITALAATAEGLYAGNSDGNVVYWPAGRFDEPEVIHRGLKRAVESIVPVTRHGVRRLIFTDTSHRIHGRVLGDRFACEYEAGGQTLRRVEVASDMLVATTELRDRLIGWAPGRPDKPLWTINVAAMTGRNIQDVCLVPASTADSASS